MSKGLTNVLAFMLLYSIVICITAAFVTHWALLGLIIIATARYKDDYCEKCGHIIGDAK